MAGQVAGSHFWVGPGTERSLTPSLPSSLVFLAGVWVGFAPYVLHYSSAVTVTGSDVLVALIVSVLALARTIVPRDWPLFSVANAVLGCWLLLTPFTLGTLFGVTDPRRAVVDDVVVGALLLALGGLSAYLTYRQRSVTRTARER
ncbi:hypothetical protein M8542_47895 [Amycolatopsis sp. OK19-0408]|uniref:SPW repeat-containing integral membrane domain-containing protein n=2 Tax=Amycolatopsis iheyensis TaxID=2945988 RepID=A0A9X2NMQ2_9PSEU|nr:hypothetical protein [Amycolatopsis iheyensis]